METDKIYGYFGRLLAIYDYDHDRLGERSISEFDKKRGLAEIATLGNSIRGKGYTTVSFLWNRVGDDFPRIGAKDVLSCEEWDVSEIYQAYANQTTDIIISDKLRDSFSDIYGDPKAHLFDGAKDLGLRNFWALDHWMSKRREMPSSLKAAVRDWDGKGTFVELAQVWREKSHG